MKSYQQIEQDLQKKFGEEAFMINIDDLSNVTGWSTGTIKNYLNSDYDMPRYFKLGRGKNASIRFYLSDVAEYLYSLQLKDSIKEKKDVATS